MRMLRYAAAALAVLLLLAALPACSGESEVPKGYQYATCAGEYFRLFVPTQWTVNTGSGVSGAYITIDTTVTMRQVVFTPEDASTDSEETVSGTDGGDSGAGGNTLEAFRQAYVREIGALHDYAETDPPLATTVDGYRAILLRYTARIAGTVYRFRQVLCKVEGRFYVYSYSAPADRFDTYADIAEEIQEEIRFYHTPYEGSAATRKIPEDGNAPEGMKLVSTDAVAFRFYVPLAWETDMENSANLVYVTEADGSRSNVTMIGICRRMRASALTITGRCAACSTRTHCRPLPSCLPTRKVNPAAKRERSATGRQSSTPTPTVWAGTPTRCGRLSVPIPPWCIL